MSTPGTVHPALRPLPARHPRDGGGRGRGVRRRLRDLGVMLVAGPLAGTLAIVAMRVALGPRLAAEAEAARQADAQRALAILEDRPLPGLRPAAPFAQADAARARLPAPVRLQVADFGSVRPTPDARRMADWVVSRADNGRLPFVVVDKRDARLYVFDVVGRLVGQTPVLLGSAHGDDTYPGIGDVPIPDVKPYQRTTAAGRFVTRPGLDADHTDVVWLDYDAALAMHRVIDKVKAERRPQRLAAADPRLRRISWGCINIPVAFFDSYISPVFGKHTGVTYVIPERKTFEAVFDKNPGAPPAAAASAGAPLPPRDIADR